MKLSREERGINPISDEILKDFIKSDLYKQVNSLYLFEYRKQFNELKQYYTDRQFLYIRKAVLQLLQTIDVATYSIGGMIAINHYWFRLKSALKTKLKGTDITLKTWLQRKFMLITDGQYIVDVHSMHYRTGTPEFVKKAFNTAYTKWQLAKTKTIELIEKQDKVIQVPEKVKIVNDRIRLLQGYERNMFSKSYFSLSVAKKAYSLLLKKLDNEELDPFLSTENKNKLKIEKILKTSHKLWDNDILESNASVKISYTGRIYQIHNEGTQGLSRVMKQRNLMAMRKIWGKENVINYDMPSAQLNALLDIADQVGLDLPNLKEYVDNKESKEMIAKACGLDKSVVKLLVLSYIFGAKNRLTEESAHYDILRSYYKYVTNDVIEKYNKFKFVTDDLVKDIRKFLNKSIDIAKVLNMIDLDKNTATNNVVEVDLSLLQDEQGNLSKSKVTAFLLQGKEQEFILDVMYLLFQYNIEVLSYEFDGLLVQGVIPESIIKEARIRTNFNRASLVTKDFDNSEELGDNVGSNNEVEFDIIKEFRKCDWFKKCSDVAF